jgi:anti-anti-sigma factor
MVGPVVLVRPIEAEYLDRQQIMLLSDELETFVTDNQPEKIVLTLKQVSKYSSEAIGGLVRVYRQVRKYGGDMKLCMTAELRVLFRAAGLDGSVFHIYATESDAIAAFFEHGGDLFE